MPVPESFINSLKMSCDIVSTVSGYLPLKRAGRYYKGLCPFHNEKTPSFTVYEDTQSFYCFGCGAGGDVVTFIKMIENLDYIEALKLLAQRAGIVFPDDGYDDKAARLKQRIYEINREAARFFHSCLKTPEGKAGLEYFAKRRLTAKTVTEFGLGFAPDSWNMLKNHLLDKGYTLAEMSAAAVISRRSNGSYYDKFRNRVIFPIIDLRGNVAAFSGRVLDDSKPKYINTDDTPVYKKSRTLFSLNFAKSGNGGQIILCEGNVDVISLYQAGFKNAVASCGTSLTPEQCRLISNYADEVIIAFDSDEAGRTAARKAHRLLSETGLRVRIISIPNAKDADEYINKFGSTRFKLLLDDSKSVTEFELKRLSSLYDLDTDAQKVQFLNEAAKFLATLSDPLEQDIYASRLANEYSVSRETLSAQIQAEKRRLKKAGSKKQWKEIEQNKAVYSDRINPQRAGHLREARAEEGIIAYLYKNPDTLEAVAEKLTEADFVTDFNRKVFVRLSSWIRQNKQPDLSMFGEDFKNEEIGKISGMLASHHMDSGDIEELNACIDVLIKYKNRITPDRVADMSPEEIYDSIRKQKNN